MSSVDNTSQSFASPKAKDSQRIRRLFAAIAGRYDCANHLLSFGIDLLWQRRLLRAAKEARSDLPVMDLCTGTGSFLPGLCGHFDAVVGVDFCRPMLERAPSTNASLVEGDACALPIASASCGLVTVGYGLRNVASLSQALSEINRILAPKGLLLVLEFGVVPQTLWGRLFSWYSRRILPLMGGILTGNADAYRYLAASSAEFPAGDAFCRQLLDAGFVEARHRSQTGGVAYLYSARKRGFEGSK